MPGPRIVEIQHHSVGGEEGGYKSGWFCPKESRNKPITLLRVCKQSREEVLKHWVPLMPYKESTVHYDFGAILVTRREEPVVISYFNARIDTLYLGPMPYEHFGALSEASLRALDSIKCLKHTQFLLCQWDVYLRPKYDAPVYDGITHSNYRMHTTPYNRRPKGEATHLQELLRQFPKLKSLHLEWLDNCWFPDEEETIYHRREGELNHHPFEELSQPARKWYKRIAYEIADGFQEETTSAGLRLGFGCVHRGNSGPSI